MLVWKTQTLNIHMASLRYRCLLPLRYLTAQGISSKVYSASDPVKLTPQTQALVFVKSFRDEDVATCEQAYQLGVPVILDLCDNIFIDEYAADNDYVPAKNFRLMAQQAAAIVTTGTAMKAEVERALTPLNLTLPVVVIPDGNETLDDIDFALRTIRWQWMACLLRRQVSRKILWSGRASKQIYGKGKQQLKNLFVRGKAEVGQRLRPFGLLAPLPNKLPHELKNELKNELPHEPCASKPNKPLCAAVDQSPTKSPAKSVTVQPVPLRPAPWPVTTASVKTVLWFGNHGAKYGNFGMLNILAVASALETLSQEQPLRLVVVSNSREKYDIHIAPLPFESVYLPWHPRQIYQYIQASDVVIIPNSQSVYSICKSANRAVLALSQGTPVVASRTPALDMFADCIWLDEWETGLRAYLRQPDIAKAHVTRAQQVIYHNLRGEAIAQQWQTLLQTLQTGRNQTGSNSDGK